MLLPLPGVFLPHVASGQQAPIRRLQPLGGPTGNGALLEIALRAEHSSADCRLVLEITNVSDSNRLDRLTLEFRALDSARKELLNYELDLGQIKPNAAYNTFIPMKLSCDKVAEVRLDETRYCVVDDVARFDCLSFLRLRSPGRVKFER